MAKPEHNLVHVDLLRGLAAVEVLLGHLRQLVLVDYPQVSAPWLGAKLLYLTSSFGHEAVMVFFVMSGFFIAGSVMHRLRTGGWSWGDYAVQRLTRLHLVLIPALLLGGLWDHLLLRALPAGDPLATAVASRHGIDVFLGNAFYLQSIRVPYFGSNGPLWSLSYELWYYLLFPLLAMALLPGLRLRRTITLALAAAVLLFVGRDVAAYFPVWLLGAAVNLLPRLSPGRARGLSVLGFLLVFAILALESTGRLAGGYRLDLVVAVGSAVAMWGLVHQPPPRWKGYRTVAGGLAAVSYTLYLVHYPFVLFVTAVMLHGLRRQPDAPGLAVMGMLLVAVAIYTWAVWGLAEAHTARLRARVSAWLRPNPTGEAISKL
jgi:peptidoglycan/LPS O-acetylase OafA/YrhL